MVGGEGRHCGEDPQCFNRLHPAIPMAARAQPGQTIVFRVRNASDFDLDPASTSETAGRRRADRNRAPARGAGPHRGAEPGDVLAVTLLDVAPGRFGYTSVSPSASSRTTSAGRSGPTGVSTARRQSATTARRAHSERQLPGIVTVLPGPAELAAMLAREAELRAVGGAGSRRIPCTPRRLRSAAPTARTPPSACARSRPASTAATSTSLSPGRGDGVPALLRGGCGLSIGDPHFAQGDGEVSGTAIEMDADFTVTTASSRTARRSAAARTSRGRSACSTSRRAASTPRPGFR